MALPCPSMISAVLWMSPRRPRTSSVGPISVILLASTTRAALYNMLSPGPTVTIVVFLNTIKLAQPFDRKIGLIIRVHVEAVALVTVKISYPGYSFLCE